MSSRPIILRWTPLVAVLSLISLFLSVLVDPPTASAATTTTAWQNGNFNLNPGGVVSRSDIVLGTPNTQAAQSLGLGNGSLGVAAWAAGGFTAQLNRTDTMPDRKSPGQVQIPGLSTMTSASDFTGRLDLYNGVLTESGGGQTLKAWVPSGKDELIVDVTGANPNTTQTADVHLWSGRNPTAATSGTIGTLAETWVDNAEQEPSGRTFGSLAAITAGGQGVSTSVVNSTTVQVSFKPNADGSYRIVVGAPSWTGGNAATTAAALLGGDATAAESTLLSSQSTWWNGFWAKSGLIELNSSDGSAQYMEALRTIYLYTEAASMRGTYPGSQAGVTDMFNFGQDQQNWTPSSTWLWNLRTQISANMTSGNYALNTPIFDLYLNNLAAIETWTKAQMSGHAGACVPEVMRFNGNGGDPSAGANAACSEPGSPNWNALDITSGAEISLYVWQQYQATGDTAFLTKYYPLMQQSAIFLLGYQTKGSDGLLHATANAHETQWAVTDPTTDIVADQALFPAVISAAQKLGTDASLVSQLQTALGELPPYARTDEATRTQLLTPADDAAGADVIADSYQPAATIRNSENIGLEPVWPWNVISDTSSMLALAKRTYTYRPVTGGNDWSLDAIQAARLGLAGEVQNRLVGITESHQVYISGMADLGSTVGTESYIEQAAGVAAGVDEALVQDYDGLLRFAPAWPSGWDAAGTVFIQDGGKVDVQMEGGTLATAAIHAGTTETMKVRNPWSGKSAEVVNGSTGAVVVAATTAGTLSVPVTAGQSYLVEQPSALTTSLPYAQVTGTAATTAKHLGGVKIGLDGAGGVAGPTFYPNTNYGGTGVKLGDGSYTISQMEAAGITNDAISSIRVPAGFTVVAYADGDFTGASWTFTADNADLTGLGANDTISSFKITGSAAG
ncbi:MULTISPECIES: glycosyl hydrolase family 95 catalytic domain-containing protein [unclassified Streptomyces]|uniref:glycosyl hydrolase family 95 catalytic domain-containing protein n=1 Tax=unclassified Streptomyces TaxID=2593676 RepID=UPI00344F421F